MNWAKAKTILIVVFLLLNLFLLFTYNSIQQTVSETDMQQLSQVLEKNNLTLAPDILEKTPAKLQSVEFINLAVDAVSCAQRFFGDDYTVVSDSEYKQGSKTLLVNRNMVEYRDSEPQDSSYQGLTEDRIERQVRGKLSELGLPEKTLICSGQSRDSFGQLELTYHLRHHSLSVFNSMVQVTVSDNGISSIIGVLLAINNSSQMEMEYEILNTQNILLELLSNPELNDQSPHTIEALHLGYYIPKNDFAISAEAIPAYQIVVDNGKVYYYDARVSVPNTVRLLAAETAVSQISEE